jgi:hypothetical protein
MRHEKGAELKANDPGCQDFHESPLNLLPMFHKSVLLGLLLAIGSVLHAQPTTVESVDSIFITSVTPSAAKGGEETLFDVKYMYHLESQATAFVQLVANVDHPAELTSMAQTEINRGSGSGTISAKLIPRKWSELIPFKIGLGLLCTGDDKFKKWLVATDDRPLKVTEPRTVDPTFADSKAVYEDGVSIISVSPESFQEDVAQEIRVRVRYELFSREKGEVNVGTSGGRSNGYVIINSTPVKIGRGEIEVRCQFNPKKTGGLPLAKIFVNLSELPHQKTWRPQAEDQTVVTILE